VIHQKTVFGVTLLLVLSVDLSANTCISVRGYLVPNTVDKATIFSEV